MINILRIGHRISRDKRITTHVALVSRAFGADKIFIDTLDKKIEETITSTVKRFGGNFEIITGVDKKKILHSWNGTIVHLTMYGEKLNKVVNKIDKNKDLLIIVGAEKVPPWIYEISDYNISVGNQPQPLQFFLIDIQMENGLIKNLMEILKSFLAIRAKKLYQKNFRLTK